MSSGRIGMSGPMMEPSEYPYSVSSSMMPSNPYGYYYQSFNNLNLFHVPTDATNSLYVDGVPNDSNEREVSHIFRPFPGFECVRLIRKTTSTGREYFLCFVDFQDSLQSTIALNTVQGYRFDRHDKIGLKISYANDPKDNKDKRRH